MSRARGMLAAMTAGQVARGADPRWVQLVEAAALIYGELEPGMTVQMAGAGVDDGHGGALQIIVDAAGQVSKVACAPAGDGEFMAYVERWVVNLAAPDDAAGAEDGQGPERP